MSIFHDKDRAQRDYVQAQEPGMDMSRGAPDTAGTRARDWAKWGYVQAQAQVEGMSLGGMGLAGR